MIVADTLEFELRKRLVELALLQHHKPYVAKASGPNSFDCAGLVRYLYLMICGIDLYGYSKISSATSILMRENIGKLSLYGGSEDIPSYFTQLQSGDILFFHALHANGYPGHCGIYLEGSSFIHATSSIGKVVISDFCKNPYWETVFVGSKNILSDEKILARIKHL